MTDFIYGYNLRYSTLFIYSKDFNRYKPYVANIQNSVEDVCRYCKLHSINACLVNDKTVKGIIESIIVKSIMFAYGLQSSKKHLRNFIENFIIANNLIYDDKSPNLD